MSTSTTMPEIRNQALLIEGLTQRAHTYLEWFQDRHADPKRVTASIAQELKDTHIPDRIDKWRSPLYPWVEVNKHASEGDYDKVIALLNGILTRTQGLRFGLDPRCPVAGYSEKTYPLQVQTRESETAPDISQRPHSLERLLSALQSGGLRILYQNAQWKAHLYMYKKGPENIPVLLPPFQGDSCQQLIETVVDNIRGKILFEARQESRGFWDPFGISDRLTWNEPEPVNPKFADCPQLLAVADQYKFEISLNFFNNRWNALMSGMRDCPVSFVVLPGESRSESFSHFIGQGASPAGALQDVAKNSQGVVLMTNRDDRKKMLGSIPSDLAYYPLRHGLKGDFEKS